MQCVQLIRSATCRIALLQRCASSVRPRPNHVTRAAALASAYSSSCHVPSGHVSPTANQVRSRSTAVQPDPHELHFNKRLEGATFDTETRLVTCEWEGGHVSQFPFVYLRDSCRCASCFHPVAKARLILMRNLPLDSRPTAVKVDADARQLHVHWEDGHVSPFDFRFLMEHEFTAHAQEQRDAYWHKKPHLWGPELTDNLPTADYTQVMTQDSALYDWLTDLEQYGICLIRNTPPEPGQLKKLVDRVSFCRPTHYGEYFEVKSKQDPSNLAYTARSLGLHTDIPYDRHPPGVQLLHCIKQTSCEGGHNQFSDSFNAIRLIGERAPEYYDLLTRQPIDFIDVGTDMYGNFSKLSRHSTFTMDVEGNIAAIQYSNQTRDSFLKLPLEKVEPMIRALRMLEDVLNENHINIKMEDGDIATFGNRRVLHGRSSYTLQAGVKDERHLQGTYIDLDEINSMRRVLKDRLNLPTHH